MTDHLTEAEIIAAIPGLTPTRLIAFIEAEMVIPLAQEGTAKGRVFHRIDRVRLELLCELADDLDLDETALGVIITLIDQLHAARADVLALTRALQSEPAEIRARIGAALIRSAP